MVKMLVGLVLIAHGLIHLIGFVVPWQFVTVEGFAYRTTVLGGMDIGEMGVRLLGLLWLLTAIGFVVAGIALLAGWAWWQPLTMLVAILSLVVCILNWPDSMFGALTDVLLLSYLFADERLQWVPLRR